MSLEWDEMKTSLYPQILAVFLLRSCRHGKSSGEAPVVVGLQLQGFWRPNEICTFGCCNYLGA